MKIVAILENSISIGGGFSQSLNAIIQMNDLSKDKFEFSVISTHNNNLDILKRMGIKCFYFKKTLVDKIHSTLVLSELFYKLIARFKLLSPFEKKIKSIKCDLVYFVAPTSTMSILQSLNYIATVWDSSHRDSPEFDELRIFGEFRKREYIYKNYLSQAFLVLVDSEISKQSVHYRYGLDKEKTIVMPFSPNPLMEIDEKKSIQEIIKKYNLKKDYLFYPAQFWSHKNHLRVLQALKILKQKNIFINIVFSGGTPSNSNGYFDKVLKFVDENNLNNQVSILGFIPANEISAIYEASKAVIFPSYLGPTNIPPLEAWLYKKPLLCSELHKEQVGKGAILFNPDDAEDIVRSIMQLKNEKVLKILLTEAKKQIQLINEKRKVSELILISKLNSYKLRLE